MRRSIKRFSIITTNGDLTQKEELLVLRVLIKLNKLNNILEKIGKKQFTIDYKYENILMLLGMESYLNIDFNEEIKNNILNTLKDRLNFLESHYDNLKYNKTLKNNIEKLSKIISLNKYEEDVLECVISILQNNILNEFFDDIFGDINSKSFLFIISIISNIELSIIKDIFSKKSKLYKTAILKIYYNGVDIFSRKVDILNEEFGDNLYNNDKDDILFMIKDFVSKKNNHSTLTIDDYNHIYTEINILVSYLKNVFRKKITGVNILLYGSPGTGKSELCKVLASDLKLNLFEISSSNTEGDIINKDERIKAYKIAQYLLSNKNTLLVFDEAEDIFENSLLSFFFSKKQKNKAWLNNMLENNKIPTIWITNNINNIDNAVIRRFDLAIELPIPNKKQREKILKRYLGDIINDDNINNIVQHENVAPAFVQRAKKVISNINIDKTNSLFVVLNNTLKAQGFKQINQHAINTNSVYDLDFINTNSNLKEMVEQLKQNPNVRICLYGPPGTGKSAFGQYVANFLNKPFILKKGSDLLSMWVGETEKNIANAFEEAKKDEAVLIFDEVDSFLADRNYAQRNWEITQTNEMLTQMESFNGIFIATTNLIDKIDKASLRRFDLKLNFDYLTIDSSYKLLIKYLKILDLNIDKNLKSKLEKIKYITVGDFQTIFRQSRFRKINSSDEFLQRLKEEVLLKDKNFVNKIGF